MPAALFLLLFLMLPLAEIAVFIAVGSEIGVGWTLLAVIGLLVGGVALVRRQSFSTLQSARAEARSGHVPAREIVHGAMIVFAGLLMIVPGFVTGTLGLLLLIPPVRDLVWHRIKGRIVVQGMRGAPPHHPYAQGRPQVVDLTTDEFHRADEDEAPRRDEPVDSPWTPVDDERPRRD